MEWAYAITTVKGRERLLKQTVDSLERAEFDRPWIFCDQGTGAFGNWLLALLEIYLRSPKADRFAVFQDDLITYKNLRTYLERCEYPDHGYLNLYTMPHNVRCKRGWYLSNQMGKGAVGLVFDNVTVRALLSSHYLYDHAQHDKYGKKCIDGTVLTSLKRHGWHEYVHNPSLLQHTGDKTTMSQPHPKQMKANTFIDEDFDALDLFKGQVRMKTQHRIGLVGFNCRSGLGEENRQLAKYLDIDQWLIKPHGKYREETVPKDVFTWIGQRIEDFIDSIDVLLFVETPLFKGMCKYAKDKGKRVVCRPNVEWIPKGDWTEHVDLFVCPTMQCFNEIRYKLPCLYLPWPVDYTRFDKVRRIRTKCNKFAFINGNGGFNGRKGAKAIRDALTAWPEMPLIVYSQIKQHWPSGITVLDELDDNRDLYTFADVLLAPRCADGLGLELREAMSCGMPVISTAGAPWSEFPALARIPARIEKRKIMSTIDWHYADGKKLADICRKWHGQDITQASKDAQQWAKSLDWNTYRSVITDLVRTGEMRVEIPEFVS